MGLPHWRLYSAGRFGVAGVDVLLMATVRACASARNGGRPLQASHRALGRLLLATGQRCRTQADARLLRVCRGPSVAELKTAPESAAH